MSTKSSSSLAVAAVRGTTWTYIAFFSSKLVVFITTILLARLLTKGDFGVVGYAVTIIGFLDVMKDLGVGASLIYHNDERATPTAFWLGLFAGILFFLLAWFGSPAVGLFFNDPRAVWVTRILALNFPLGALGAVHETLLVKELAFNRKFIPDFSKAISKGFISISLAYAGFGPWSLIIGQLGGTLVSTVILWWIVSWRPRLAFSPDISRSLLNFGIPLVGMNIISVFVLNVDYLLVGRYLGAEALGVYTLAFRVPEMTILQLCNIVAQVIFPVFTKIRNDKEALGRGFLQTAQYVALITIPIGVGMAMLAEPFVLVFFGEKWIEVVPVMRAIAIYSVLLSLGYNAGDVYKAQGKPGVLTKISIIQAGMLLPALLWAVTVSGSIVVVGWTQAFMALIGATIYLFVAMRMLEVSPVRLLGALRHPMVPVIGMSAVVMTVLYFFPNLSALMQLIIGIFSGAVSYLVILYFLSPKIVMDTIELVRTLLFKRVKSGKQEEVL